MDGEQIAEGLDFPEGPVWDDGTLWFTEIIGGRISRWTADGGVERVAETGGGPNGATLGADGSLFVTQNGGMDSDDRGCPASILRVHRRRRRQHRCRRGRRAFASTDRTISRSATTDGSTSPTHAAPPTLHTTTDRAGSSRSTSCPALGCSSQRSARCSRTASGSLSDGTLLWTESFTRRVMRLGPDGPVMVTELPDRHFPDGFCVDAEDRLWVASTWAHCVTVFDGDQIVERLTLRRRHGHELLLRRHRPVRHGVAARHAVAVPRSE